MKRAVMRPFSRHSSRYNINGVTYIVTNRFSTDILEKGYFLKDTLKSAVKNEVVPLTVDNTPDKMSDRYMCPTAGEEV